MFMSRFMPCPTCGESIERQLADTHRCDPERLITFHMFGLRDEVEVVESQFRAFLETPVGRFERWLAWRAVTAGP